MDDRLTAKIKPTKYILCKLDCTVHIVIYCVLIANNIILRVGHACIVLGASPSYTKRMGLVNGVCSR